MAVSVQKTSSPEDLERCLNIRHLVFVIGQKVPVDEDVDGKDALCDHYLLEVFDTPVATARVRYINPCAKIERVAVLDSYQGQGLGMHLMQHILSELKTRPEIKKAQLGAQTQAIAFYEKLGFSVCSDEYLDAGIKHKDMVCFFQQHA